MPKREKLNIRLPDDDGPNPYDSKTPLDQRPLWMKNLPLAVALGVGLILVRYWGDIARYLSGG